MTVVEVQLVAVVAAAAVILVVRVRTGHAPAWIQRRLSERREGRTARSAAKARLIAGVFLVGVLPWPVYLVVRPHVGSDGGALAVAAAIPVAAVLVRSARRRRIDAIGVSVLVAYVAAVALSVLFGGSSLPLKLRDVIALGVVGFGCLGSVLVRRPLLEVILGWIARRNGRPPGGWQDRLRDPLFRRDLTAATLLVGTLFVLATLIEIGLILTVSTSTFLALAGPLGGITPIAAVAGAIALLQRRRASEAHRIEAASRR
jgi:hypothetical protein